MGIVFRCQYGDANLCMSGSTCGQLNLSDSGQVVETCICPPGYSHDRIGGHFDNCSFPENGYLGILVSFSIVGFICIAFVVRFYPITKGWRLRRLLLILLGSLISEWIMIVLIYVESGSFLSNIFAGFNSAGICVLALEGAVTLLEPMITLDPQHVVRMRRTFTLAEICIVFLMFACYFPMATTSRFEDQGIYNAIFVVMIIMTLLFLVFGTIIVSRAMAELETRTRESVLVAKHARNQTAAVALADKLNVARKALVRTTILQVVPLIPVPILVAVLGSVPYMWIFALLLISVNFLATVVIINIVAKEQSVAIARIFCVFSSTTSVEAESKISERLGSTPDGDLSPKISERLGSTPDGDLSPTVSPSVD